MITTRHAYSLGISAMGKSIRPDWREVNSGNGATASISGELFSHPEGIPDLRVPNTELNDCDQLSIQMAGKNILIKLVLNRKNNGEPFTG
jgi:hypothetical protein